MFVVIFSVNLWCIFYATVVDPHPPYQRSSAHLYLQVLTTQPHTTCRIETNRRATRVGIFEFCVPTHVALRMFIMEVLASQLPFLANTSASLPVPLSFWPVNCIKVTGEAGRGHVALLSGPTVYSLYCAHTQGLPPSAPSPPTT